MVVLEASCLKTLGGQKPCCARHSVGQSYILLNYEGFGFTYYCYWNIVVYCLVQSLFFAIEFLSLAWLGFTLVSCALVIFVEAQ